MHLAHLDLVDVRSYHRAALDLPAGVTVFVGPNGHGKTNLLEAIHRIATGRSHRVASDAPLVRLGSEAGVIRAAVTTDAGRRRRIDLELGGRTRVRVDQQDVRRSADAIGIVRVVLFAPEDVALVRGDPGDRRRFLDDLLAQRRPAYAAARSDYDRVLRQRNQLLKQARALQGAAANAATSTLATWTQQLARQAATVIAARQAAVKALRGPTDVMYRALADRPEPITLRYRSSVGAALADDAPRTAIEDAVSAALTDVADEERRRGVTLVGPHRDDVELAIGPLPARGYASHGEAWSLALALRLATYEVLAEVGDRPVVLLDDVFAELDDARRAHLAAACERWDQVLVTAAVERDVPVAGRRADVRLQDGVSAVHPRPAVADGAA